MIRVLNAVDKCFGYYYYFSVQLQPLHSVVLFQHGRDRIWLEHVWCFIPDCKPRTYEPVAASQACSQHADVYFIVHGLILIYRPSIN